VNPVHAERGRAGRAEGGCELREFALLPAPEAAPESPARHGLRRPRSAATWHRAFALRTFFGSSSYVSSHVGTEICTRQFVGE
jgi:hypothetical protein